MLSFLAEQSQDFSPVKLRDVSEALVSKKLLEHKDTHISLLAARCLAEIVRICAPEAPFDESTSIVVFDHFSNHLKGLKRVNGPDYPQIFELLKNLAEVKAYILLAFTNMDKTLSTFEIFFSIIHRDHFESRTGELLLQIMCDVVMELEEIPDALLDLVFGKLVSPSKDDAPEAYQLAKHLVARCASVLDKSLSQYLTRMLESYPKNEDEKESDPKAQPLVLIYELFLVSSDLLLHVLPYLERDMTSDNLIVRKAVIEVLCKMFSHPNSKLHRQYVSTFGALLERFKDKEPQIRSNLVEMAGEFLQHHFDFGDAVSGVLALLEERMLDPDEAVRAQTCKTVSTLCAKVPDRVPVSLVKALAGRCADVKPKVHEVALHGLAQAYRDYELRSESPTDEQYDRFGWIPGSLMSAWSVLPSLVEQVLDEDVFGDAQVDPKTRSLRWINFFFSVVEDENALLCFRRMLKAKKAAQNAFAVLMSLAPRKKQLDQADQAKFDESVRLLSNIFPNQEKNERVQQMFSQMTHAPISKACTVISTPSSSLKDIRKAEEHLVASLKKSYKTAPPFQAIVRHVSYSLLNAELIPGFFSRLDEDYTAGDEASQGSLFVVLRILSRTFPELFSDSYDALSQYLLKQNKNTELRADALCVLSTCAKQLMVSDTKALRKLLLNLATTGTPSEAKFSVNSILGLLHDKEKTDSIKNILRNFAPLPVSDDSKLPTAMAALSVITVHGRDFYSSPLDHVMTVLDDIFQAAPSDGLSDRILSMEAALKFLSRAVVSSTSMSDRSEMIGRIWKTLEHILNSNGDITSDKSASKKDAGRLRLAAAQAALKICCDRDLEVTLPVTLFEQLAWTLLDDSVEKNRKTIMAKLGKYMQNLSVRFICLPAFSCMDRSPQLRQDGAKVLASMIAWKRAWLVRALASLHGSSDPVREKNVRLFGLPEYATPYLVHMLGHWKEFDAENLAPVIKVAKCFFDAVLKKADNFTFLQSYVDEIKRHDDAVEPDCTPQIVSVCDVSHMYLAEQSKLRQWKEHTQPNSCVLPLTLFRPRAKDDVAPRLSLVPESFDLSSVKGPRGNILKTPEKKSRASTGGTANKKASRRKSKAKDDDDDDDDDEQSSVEVEIEPSPAKKTKTPEKPKPKTPTAAAKPQVRRSSGKGKEEADENSASSLEVEVAPSPAQPKPGKKGKKREVLREQEEEAVVAKKDASPPKKPKQQQAGKKKGGSKRAEPPITNKARK